MRTQSVFARHVLRRMITFEVLEKMQFWTTANLEMPTLAASRQHLSGMIAKCLRLSIRPLRIRLNTQTCLYVTVPVAPLPVIPIVACTSAYPVLDAEQLMQQARELARTAGELEAKAWRLQNPHATAIPQANEGDVSTDGSWTTVMLRNIPNNITRAGLLEILKRNGFPTICMDFLYLPMDFKRDANLGYAFLNLISEQEADRFFRVFQGFEGWGLASGKVGEVCWGQPLQGLDAHIDRYRNCPVMHSSVPEEHKPMLFRDGIRIPFPAPTKKLRAPRSC
mmetsp:Transcript_10729/g.16999  ORF Transcript_10729/g.16999 Transcript_10729/m.16999 type:complete len:280 (-) Transcript_10729:256-1095(-)